MVKKKTKKSAKKASTKEASMTAGKKKNVCEFC